MTECLRYWDYTTWLNIVFLLLAAALIARFARTGGVSMLRMMGGPPDPDAMPADPPGVPNAHLGR